MNVPSRGFWTTVVTIALLALFAFWRSPGKDLAIGSLLVAVGGYALARTIYVEWRARNSRTKIDPLFWNKLPWQIIILLLGSLMIIWTVKSPPKPTIHRASELLVEPSVGAVGSSRASNAPIDQE